MKKFEVKLKELKILNKYNCIGNPDILISDASTIKNPKNNSIIFSKKVTDEILNRLNNISDCLVIIPATVDISLLKNLEKNFFILSSNSRLDYAKIMTEIIDKKQLSCENDDGYFDSKRNIFMGKNVSIGSDTIIEPFVLIESNVIIGNDAIIKTGAKIRRFTEIGNDVFIGENVVIGTQGFGVERDIDNRLYRIPHIGGVKIDDYSEIGANSSIASGTIEPTYIGKNVIIDTSVHIAHNAYISNGTLVAGKAVISGSVVIGKNTWIGPGVIISNKINIGENAFISLGSVVIEDVGDNEKVSGNFALKHEDFMKLQAKQRITLFKERNSNKE